MLPSKEDDHTEFCPFLSLPIEIQFCILSYLDVKTVCSASTTCRDLYSLTSKNSLWRILARDYWGLRHTRRIKNLDWKLYYRQERLLFEKGKENFEWIKIRRDAFPPGRSAQTGSSIGNTIYYIGGQLTGGSRLDDIFYYDAEANRWDAIHLTELGPDKVPQFSRHQSQTVNNKIYCFGGFGDRQFYTLAVFDPACKRWEYPHVKGKAPRGRSNHSSSVVGDKLYIFGGSVGTISEYETINDFYCLDTTTLTWKRLKPDNMPSPRVGHKMMAVENLILLFGGGVWTPNRGWVRRYNDTYLYNTTTNTWKKIDTFPRPSVSSYPYIFRLGMNVLIYGGGSCVKNTVCNAVWSFNILERKWRKINFKYFY